MERGLVADADFERAVIAARRHARVSFEGLSAGDHIVGDNPHVFPIVDNVLIGGGLARIGGHASGFGDPHRRLGINVVPKLLGDALPNEAFKVRCNSVGLRGCGGRYAQNCDDEAKKQTHFVPSLNGVTR